MDHLGMRIDIKTLKPVKYAHAPKPRQTDIMVPFVDRRFQLGQIIVAVFLTIFII